MSRQTVTIVRCDRCGYETQNKATVVAAWNLMTVTGPGNHRGEQQATERLELDLCDSCEISFRDWVRGIAQTEPDIERYRNELGMSHLLK